MTDVIMHGPFKDEVDELNKKDPNSRWGNVLNEDCGVMPEGVQNLRDAIVGHKIVHVQKNAKLPSASKGGYYRWQNTADVLLTLDNGRQVALIGVSDCCASGSVDNFVQKLPTLDHIITDVGTSGVFTKWHILADMSEILELDISWNPGNPFYYAYGVEIEVIDVNEQVVEGELGSKEIGA